MQPQQLKKSLATIGHRVDKIAKIIQGLRMFSRDGSQDSFSKVSISQVVENALSLCSEKLKSRKIDLQLISPPEPLYFKGQEVEVSQVIFNLITNAYDAVENTEKPWIKIESKDIGGFIQLSVTDSGPGVPAEIRSRIMEPLFTTKPLGEGTGIGLSVSKGIIEMHGGQFKLENSTANTCFVITLPKV